MPAWAREADLPPGGHISFPIWALRLRRYEWAPEGAHSHSHLPMVAQDAPDQALISVLPNVVGQTCWIAGRVDASSGGPAACTAVRHVFTAPQGDASRTSFHTATAYSFVASA